jgi:hypothetical protein
MSLDGSKKTVTTDSPWIDVERSVRTPGNAADGVLDGTGDEDLDLLGRQPDRFGLDADLGATDRARTVPPNRTFAPLASAGLVGCRQRGA